VATAQLARVIGRQDGRALAVGSAAGAGAERDDLELAADPQRNNAFAYADDPKGLRVPCGARSRRINRRDSLEDTIADVKRHRIVRRGMRYGPQLPDAIGDDGWTAAQPS
jgi:deferrochelatase/peroxidase EfeB